MRFLFDENLSPRLARALQAEYPGSIHVGALGMRGASDRTIWDYARREGFMIVSKDNDYRQLAFLAGPPPKVIWLDVGNASTNTILTLLRDSRSTIRSFDVDEETAILVLALPDVASG